MTTLAEAVHLAGLPQPAARAFLRECNMRDDERERHLYVTGRPVEAAAIAYWIDAESDAIDEMRHERDMAQEDAGRLEKEKDDLEAEVVAAEEKVLTLESQLETAQDEIKALQGQIHEAGIDLL